ncbi:MAG: hypothetical protein EBT06_12325 [Gammaproteobacteria bacterium]|nr:hypothetical protein [Gammaproteobacteria bacterium]NBT45673.1 hypothetical protein [Gammaproteobacteria bacterium]NBY21618.1 hypothetical protein [Gammaproteobacteria bacterium]
MTPAPGAPTPTPGATPAPGAPAPTPGATPTPGAPAPIARSGRTALTGPDETISPKMITATIGCLLM